MNINELRINGLVKIRGWCIRHCGVYNLKPFLVENIAGHA